MIIFPNAKINLGLHITGRRKDGFHDIDTVFYPVGWTDALEIVKNSNESAVTQFPIIMKGAGFTEDVKQNLCYKAYALLQKQYQLPSMECFLQKAIPSGAGLGGGSSDAAATLMLINDLAGLHLSIEQLLDYASQLGSDCPFFILNKPMRANGKGTTFFPVQLTLVNYYIVIVMPLITMSTEEAYSLILPAVPEIPLESIIMLPVTQWKYVLKNDFEEKVFQKFPMLKIIKEQLYINNAVYASMSGSGTAMFGIFEKAIDLKTVFSGCKVWSGKAVY